MKELTIYPHATDCGIDCIADDESTLRVPSELDNFARAKHFTDAEMAAEGYKAQGEMLHRKFFRAEARADGDITMAYCLEPDIEDAVKKVAIIHRFATHPHALEDS